MYYVYMLRCEDNSIYTGITTDIDRRMKEHFSKGKKCAKYTYRHSAKKLETYWETETRKLASKLEYRIKQLKKEQKEELIKNKNLISDFMKDKIESYKEDKNGEDKNTDIKADLKELADEKYRKFHSNLCPGIENILGVRVPILRKYAKELCKQYTTQYLLENIDKQYYEEIMLKGMIIGLDKNLKWNEIKKYIRDFIPEINNWAVCDIFCAGLKNTKKYKSEMWKLINKYAKADNEFYLRFAIVMILDYYIEEEYLEDDFKIFNSIKNDEYYVKMAIAWAISICLIKFYEKTIEYLKYNCEIDNWTYNKAIQKAIESYRITEDQKNDLRKMKKK